MVEEIQCSELEIMENENQFQKMRMVAFGCTAGTTIAGRFASGIGGSGDGRAIAGRAERREIPEQTEFRRDGDDLELKKSNSLSAGRAVFVSA